MYNFYKLLLKFFVFVCYPVKIYGMKNIASSGREIITCNHYSFVDPIYFIAKSKRKLNNVAKKEIFKNKIFAWMLRGVKVMPIDRENVSPSVIKGIVNVLKKEELLLIFPEGTRNKETLEIKRFKEGIALIALLSKSNIVPSVIQKKPRLFKKARIFVGEPIDLSKYFEMRISKDILEEVTNLVYSQMVALKEKTQEFKGTEREYEDYCSKK